MLRLRRRKVDPPSDEEELEESEPHVSEIRIEDVQALLPKVNGDLDADVAEHILSNITFQMTHKLNRINQCLPVILEKWPKATPVEICVAFDLANCCVDDLVVELDSHSFRLEVAQEVARRTADLPRPRPREEGKDEDPSDDDDQPRRHDRREASNPDPHILTRKGRRGPRWTKKTPVDLSQIPPSPEGVPYTEWIHWSAIRRKAYMYMDDDPNAYLYRFPPVGVEPKFGPWTDAEKEKFLQKIAEVRGNSDTFEGKWGLFSLAVPGRVGYQCSNFYRLLLTNGELTDSRYIYGEDGRLHYLAGAKNSSDKKGRPPSAAPKERKSYGKLSPVTTRYDAWAAQNPIPDAVDALTGEKIKVPAMDPDGYVFDYNSWIKTMNPDCVNPYTQAKVKKRDLIVLTHENYAEFKDKIRNL
jgi:hypothetical protein